MMRERKGHNIFNEKTNKATPSPRISLPSHHGADPGATLERVLESEHHVQVLEVVVCDVRGHVELRASAGETRR